jgi:hypothetical protein
MDIFVVETPLQMLNAIEARYYFKSDRNLLMLLTSPHFSRKVFEPLFNGDEWDSIVSIHIREKEPEFVIHPGRSLWHRKFAEYYRYLKQFYYRRKLNAIGKSLGKADRLFLGNYLQNYMRHIGNQIDHRELVLLDDGTDAVRVNEFRKSGNLLTGSGGLVNLREKAHQVLHDWDSSHGENITFFSSYDLDLRNGDRLTKNEYPHLQKMAAGKPPTDKTLFLGQCLVDDQWMSKEAYFRYLWKIKRFYSNEKIAYVKHPRESKAILDEVREKLNFEIVSFDVPIEYQLAKGGMPKEVASFFCSAIENCRIIFGNKLQITAFLIRPEDLLCCHKFAAQLYMYWQNRANDRFRVIKA